MKNGRFPVDWTAFSTFYFSCVITSHSVETWILYKMCQNVDDLKRSPEFYANSLQSRFIRLGFSTYYGEMVTPIGEKGVCFRRAPPLFTLYGNWADRWLTAGSSCWVAQTWRRIRCNWGSAAELREFSQQLSRQRRIKWLTRRGQCARLKRTPRGSKQRSERPHTNKMEKCIAV